MDCNQNHVALSLLCMQFAENQKQFIPTLTLGCKHGNVQGNMLMKQILAPGVHYISLTLELLV